MKTKQNKKKSLLKKIFKIFLWIGAAFTLLLIISFLVIRIKFPPQKIKEIITVQASSALNNRRVEIGNASLNFLKGFVFDNIVVYEPSFQDSIAADSIKFVSINKAYLKYKLSSLLDRTLQISEIVIDHPEIHININEQNQTNFDDLITPSSSAAEDTTTTPEDTSTTTLNLPVAFKLDRFDFKNFNALISFQSENLTVRANIQGFSIFIKDLSIPNGSLDNIKENASARLNIVSPNSNWNFYAETIFLKNPHELDAQFDLNIDLIVNGISDVQLKGKAGLGGIISKELAQNVKIKKVPVEKLINLIFNLQIDGADGKIDIAQLTAQLADENALLIHGSISDLFTEPYLSLSVDESKIRLSKLENVLKALTPSDYKNLVQNLKLDGELSFKNTEVEGYLNSDSTGKGLRFNTIVSLKELNARYSLPLTEVEKLSINLIAAGLYNNKGLSGSNVEGEIKFLTLNTDLNDSLNINVKDFSTNLSADISDDYFPANVSLTTYVGDVWGALLDFELNFNSEEKLQNYSANANLDIKNLNIKNLPQSTVSGLVNSNISINSSSLDKIGINLNLSTDSLYLPLESDLLTISPIEMKGLVDIATDTNFQNFDAEELFLSANDFLSIKGRAEMVGLGQKGFHLEVDSASISLKELFNFLPESFKHGLENLIINGTSLISADLRGKISQQGEPEIYVEANMKTNASIDYPEIPVTVGALLGDIKLSSDGKSADITTLIDIDSLILGGLRDQPINNSSLNLTFHLPDFNKVQIDTSFLYVPDINSTITLFGNIDSLNTNPLTKVDLFYVFSTIDSVLLINDLYAFGNLNSKINLQIQQPLLAVSGKMNLNKLTVLFADQMAIKEIWGSIPFSQKYDIEKSILINEDKLVVADIEGINYNLLYPYYGNAVDEISYLKIKNISVAGYEMSNFLMDINLGNGGFKIPRFTLNLYDGNMKGNLFADMGDGPIDMEKVGYYLKANISRLNSARLLPVGSGSAKASELNMNMEFEGTGLDPAKEINLGGHLYITKIGSKFADNVLNSFDPKGTDKSIQDTKKLLKWGYKPKLISFEIKHGNMYPSIHLVKGNFLTKLIPLNLSGGKIELARIPIKFFLETQMLQVK